MAPRLRIWTALPPADDSGPPPRQAPPVAREPDIFKENGGHLTAASFRHRSVAAFSSLSTRRGEVGSVKETLEDAGGFIPSMYRMNKSRFLPAMNIMDEYVRTSSITCSFCLLTDISCD